ncbi:MAG TPA: type IV secretion system protein [Steroidobacteraceae bacterium]|jgi:type IV secretion system protein VirB6
MGFFQTFWTWLDEQLTGYIGDNTARLSAVLEPAVVTFGTLYVMVWGYLHLTGAVDQPFTVGLKRIATLALVLGVGLRLWLYNSVIVDTFYTAPTQLAAAVVGAQDPVSVVDRIWERGGSVAGFFWTNRWHMDFFTGVISSLVVWILIGLLCVYTMFLMALSRIALAVLLALGPLFISALLFERSRRLFDAWLSQLVNYALITLLTVMAAALLLRIVESYADQTAGLGTAIHTFDAVNMVLVSVLVFLVMRQVMPIAAGIAGGVSLSSMGAISSAAHFGFRQVGKIPTPWNRDSSKKGKE